MNASYLSSAFLPAVVFCVFVYAAVKNVDVFSAFTEGCREGFTTVKKIFPSLLGMMFAVGMLTSCGIVEDISALIANIFPKMKTEPLILSMALLRPFSSAAGVSVLTKIFELYTPDSLYGLTASVMQSSTDSTIYISNMYYSSCGIKDVRYTLKAGLLADATGLTCAVVLARVFWG